MPRGGQPLAKWMHAGEGPFSAAACSSMTPLAAECSLVETGLRASAFIYSETRKRVREKDEHVPIEDLKAVKKAALDVNQVGTRFSKLRTTTRHTHERS